MNGIERILCPVDLSDNSLAAIELATSLAKHYDAVLVFIYVAPQWLPDESMLGTEYIEAVIADDKKSLEQLRPAQESIRFEHQFSQGNPGPQIVRAAEDCDLIVMSTHGQSGVLRLLMGSVAEYVIRHASCPVLTVKNPKAKLNAANKPESKVARQRFATEAMHHVNPIQGFEKITDVVAELDRANQTAAPVVDERGKCIGILTTTDIARYRELQKRYEEHDESVIDEIFETDKYGQRRATNLDFDQVRRHMTSPVITVSNQDSCRQARELFAKNPTIHHLVVLDAEEHPIGLLDTKDVGSDEDVSSTAEI